MLFQTQIEKTLLELFALSILSGLTRLFLIESTISGGIKQFFGGMIFGTLIGYLFKGIPEDFIYYGLSGKIWRFWAVLSAIFGREILRLAKLLITQAAPLLGGYMLKQGRKVVAAYKAFKSFKDDNENIS